jgi:hypothetical protein
MTCCEMDSAVGEGEEEDVRCGASRVLRRLVGFVASALDVRFAFVVAFDPPSEPRRVGLWLARDYGLRSEYAQVGISEGDGPYERLDLGLLFPRVWPHEPELAGLPPERHASVALVDARGRAAGRLGIVDSERSCRLSARDRLVPLARRAAMEVERWSGGAALVESR